MQLALMPRMETQTNTGKTPAAKIHEALGDFSFVMLMTRENAGKARSRPMTIAQLDPDCTLWFITSASTATATNDAQIVGQAGMKYLSMPGKIEVLRDRARMEKMWSKAYDVWFPEGAADPDAVLLRFTPFEAELWDSAGIKGLHYLFESAKALITGEPPTPAKDQHIKTQLQKD